MEGLKITGITVTADACEQVFTTALDAGHTYGIGYWVNAAKFTPSKPTRTGEGGILTLIEDEGGKGFRLTGVDIRRAILRILQDSAEFPVTAQNMLTQEYIDGLTADIIIQVACFNEVKYG